MAKARTRLAECCVPWIIMQPLMQAMMQQKFVKLSAKHDVRVTSVRHAAKFIAAMSTRPRLHASMLTKWGTKSGLPLHACWTRVTTYL